MANLGPRDTSTVAMLTGWDATELAKWQLTDGTNITEVVSQMQFALAALNAELRTGLWGSLISITDRPEVEYRVGSSNGFEQHTEYGRPDTARAATEGHMLPYVDYDRALGWTYDYLTKQARREQIEADIADAIKDARDNWRKRILGRCLQQGDDSGTAKGLGSAGYSPGFATTAGSTNVDFTPPAYGGTTFTSTHEHYVPLAGGAFTNAVFSDAKAELREHGHEPPYMFVIGPSDETTVKGLTDFTPIAESLVAYGSTQDRALVPPEMLTVGAYPIGTIHEFAVHVVPGIPQYYGFGWKTYGQLAQRNPLRVRVWKGLSTVQVEAANDPRNGSPAHPLQYLMLQMGFGVGVADRTAGTARYVNNAVWSDGTVT